MSEWNSYRGWIECSYIQWCLEGHHGHHLRIKCTSYILGNQLIWVHHLWIDLTHVKLLEGRNTSDWLLWSYTWLISLRHNWSRLKHRDLINRNIRIVQALIRTIWGISHRIIYIQKLLLWFIWRNLVHRSLILELIVICLLNNYSI